MIAFLLFLFINSSVHADYKDYLNEIPGYYDLYRAKASNPNGSVRPAIGFLKDLHDHSSFYIKSLPKKQVLNENDIKRTADYLIQQILANGAGIGIGRSFATIEERKVAQSFFKKPASQKVEDIKGPYYKNEEEPILHEDEGIQEIKGEWKTVSTLIPFSIVGKNNSIIKINDDNKNEYSSTVQAIKAHRSALEKLMNTPEIKKARKEAQTQWQQNRSLEGWDKELGQFEQLNRTEIKERIITNRLKVEELLKSNTISDHVFVKASRIYSTYLFLDKKFVFHLTFDSLSQYFLKALNQNQYWTTDTGFNNDCNNLVDFNTITPLLSHSSYYQELNASTQDAKQKGEEISKAVKAEEEKQKQMMGELAETKEKTNVDMQRELKELRDFFQKIIKDSSYAQDTIQALTVLREYEESYIVPEMKKLYNTMMKREPITRTWNDQPILFKTYQEKPGKYFTDGVDEIIMFILKNSSGLKMGTYLHGNPNALGLDYTSPLPNNEKDFENTLLVAMRSHINEGIQVLKQSRDILKNCPDLQKDFLSKAFQNWAVCIALRVDKIREWVRIHE